MSRDTMVRVLVALLVIVAGAWFVTATEWADVEIEKPAKGEAAKNRFYATQALLRSLGAQVVKRQDLDVMPPPQGHLVLASRHWDLFPDRAIRLREWVQQGGHLVITSALVDHRQLKWIPISEPKPQKSDDDDDDEHAKPVRGKPAKDSDCIELKEPDTNPESYSGSRSMRICAPYFPLEAEGAPPQWQLQGPRGASMLRVALGRGSVTVFGPWAFLENRSILRGDNALAAVAAMQVRAGEPFWFVVEEARKPLLAWLWAEAWPVVLAALLALALFLWRGAVRFGPMVSVMGNHRRSMMEQIGGTANFLQRHGGAALHAAQVRALHEAAMPQLRHYRLLKDAQRVQALAAATGLEADSLTRALMRRKRTQGELAADIDLLEAALRLVKHSP